MKLAIKNSKSILWKTNYDHSSIQDSIQKKEIDHNWLVCPLGESDKAITVGEYLNKPSIFTPIKKLQENKYRAETANKEASLLQIGLITLISAVFFRLSLNTFLIVNANPINSFAKTKFKVAFWNQCNELCTIGLWSGAILLVTHVIFTKTKMFKAQ
jgi:hypothetical protein